MKKINKGLLLLLPLVSIASSCTQLQPQEDLISTDRGLLRVVPQDSNRLTLESLSYDQESAILRANYIVRYPNFGTGDSLRLELPDGTTLEAMGTQRTATRRYKRPSRQRFTVQLPR